MRDMLKALLSLLSCLLIAINLIGQEREGNLRFVDPAIGTVGHLLESTRPTMHLPNSMVRVYPVRQDQLDDQIDYFPLSIYSYRIGNVFYVMPAERAATYSEQVTPQTYDMEQSAPHCYSVILEESQMKVEYTPSQRSGYFRFTSMCDEGIILRAGVINGGGLELDSKFVITGVEEFKQMKAYVYVEFSSEIERVAGSDKNIVLKCSANSLEMRYGLSFISIEQAKQNLSKEIAKWGFDDTKASAQKAWEQVLGQINIKGGTHTQKRSFYTALYRTYERMVNINEYGQYYSAYDHKIHKDNRPFYVDNWIWDSYLAHEPLHMILNPKAEADKLESYVKMYEQSGWMPSFALVFGDNPCMTGNHAAAWMCDAWLKGIRNFDMKKGYEGVRKNSTQATLLPWKNGQRTSLDMFYEQHNYFPALKSGESENVSDVDSFEKRQSVAVTLQHSYDDWCISKLADELGLDDDSKFFMKRSNNYKNVFRTEKGFVWPKDSDGNWIEDFDPIISGGLGGRQYFTENNAYTYNWDVKHDIYTLFELMGGPTMAEAKLDQLFREKPNMSKYRFFATLPDATGLVGQFVMGNEPSFHIPYLYNYLGAPWKTQKRIRSLINTWFPDNIFGVPGDEDGGAMSAFVVFSMMGFYPVTPGSPIYAIGSPIFEETSLLLPNGRDFTIKALGNSDNAKYIQSAKFNGKEWNKAWFTHQELIDGGTLEFTMGESPNKQWGVGQTPPLN